VHRLTVADPLAPATVPREQARSAVQVAVHRR
jgi:hypothetical protein